MNFEDMNKLAEYPGLKTRVAELEAECERNADLAGLYALRMNANAARVAELEARKPLVEVHDLYGQGTGPWRLFVNGVGVADWPTARSCDPKEYAEEVARCVRLALSTPTGSTEDGR